ncbi:MAG: CopD family protein [Sphingobacteriaceae bacterium]|nr:CopD family protein [Sphingobacteriaceae bacterium]
MYLYIKALHILFVVTWFAGLFYFVRLLIYNVEAGARDAVARDILREQYKGQLLRLWRGITVPSAVITGVFGLWMWHLYGSLPGWLAVKLAFVAGLYLYHISCWYLYRQQLQGIFKYSGQQLRVWNEVATVFLVAIIFLVVLKSTLSMAWGLLGLFGFIGLLMGGIVWYKRSRAK